MFSKFDYVENSIVVILQTVEEKKLTCKIDMRFVVLGEI